MSDDSTPQELPPVSPTPAAPASAPAEPAAATAPTPPATPAPVAPKPPVPTPIDYAIGAPKKPFTLPRSTFLFVKMFVGLCVVLGMGYFALVALNPRARQWATQGGADGSGGPTPFKALNQILAIPARAIGKTKDVVAASDARVGVLDKVIAADSAKPGGDAKPLADIFSAPAKGKAADTDKDPDDKTISREALLALAEKNATAPDRPPKATLAKAVPVIPPPPPGPAEMKLGGGITITNLPAADATPASAPFMYWVASLGVSGVSNTTPPRFLMNGRLVREGDEVNRTLAVTFDHLDATAKLIYFRDKSGAMVSRSY